MTNHIVKEDEQPPEGVRVLPNGAWQDIETGKIVRAAPGQAWDSAKASEMAKKRWAEAREKTREGIQKAVQKKNPDKVIESFPEAHGQVIETLMDEVVLNKGEKGKARVDAYETILGIEGSIRTNKEVAKEAAQRGITIGFSPEVAKYMVDRLMERQQGQDPEIITVEAREA